MGNRYVVMRENFTPTTGQDALTLISPANRRIRLLAVYCNGLYTALDAQAMKISRVASAGTTPGGAITPTKADHVDQPAATFTTATTWSTQPTPETNGVVIGFQAFGGHGQWQATQLTRGMFEARNGEQLSLRPGAGITSLRPQSLEVVVEED